MLSTVAEDVRYVLRTLRRNPGFSVAATVPIALGIGINTGVFTILNNVMFRTVPAPNAAALVSVYQDFRGVKGRSVHGARSMFSVPEYRAYRDATQTLSGVTAFTKTWTVTLGAPVPETVEGVLVACNYFEVLQVRPALGTGFTSANCEVPSARPAVVLSYQTWQRVFAADPEIVTKAITMNGHSVAVVGVAPPGFDGTELTRAAFFAPLALQPAFHPERNYLADPQVSWLTLLGRRHERTTLDQVRAELTVIAHRIDRQQPGRTTTLLIDSATSLSLPVARRNLTAYAVAIVAAFGLILLLACANVANVLLARGEARSREIALRLALGARRVRLIRLLLTESVVIALIGGTAGSLLAWWSFAALLPTMLAAVPGISQPRLDAHPNLSVLWFAMALIGTTVLMCGLVPAVRASRPNLHGVMARDADQTSGRSSGWLRAGLIASQVAICTVLLVTASLVLRGLQAAYSLDPGFEYADVAVVSVDLRAPHFTEGRVEALRTAALEQVATIPSVISIAQLSKVPLTPGRNQATFRLPASEQTHEFDVNTVSPDYFKVLRIPILSGRTFTPAEMNRGSRVAIITEATARRFWPGRDPIGLTIVAASDTENVLQIVGVARDTRATHTRDAGSGFLYLPATPSAERRLSLVVRHQTELVVLVPTVRAALQRLDSGLVPQVYPLEMRLDFWRKLSRSVATLAGSLSLLATALVAIGVYGVVSYIVTRRRREVGIRVALGASPRAIHALFLRATLRPVVLGMLGGVAAAVATSRVVAHLLFGISPLDPVAFGAAALFLLAVATTAIVLPTRRALNAEPISALRHD